MAEALILFVLVTVTGWITLSLQGKKKKIHWLLTPVPQNVTLCGNRVIEAVISLDEFILGEDGFNSI